MNDSSNPSETAQFAMEAYQNSSRGIAPPSGTEPSRSETRSAAPTPSDLAQWKEESDRFLHDVRRRLDDILSELDRKQMVPSAVQVARRDPETESGTENSPVEPARSDDDRISVLKAQLARKLHDLEQAANGTFNTGVGR